MRGGGAAGRAGGQRRRSTGGCWCGTRREPGPARPSSAATTAGCARWRCCRTGGWSAAADDGRVLVWDPARAGGRPGRARPPRRRGDGGGGAAGRAGGQRRRSTGGCWCGTRREPGAAPVELGRHDGRVPGGGGAAGRAGGQRRRTTGGCWCGTRRTPGPARSSSAATTAGSRRWRCCRTGGWSAPAVGRAGAGVGPGAAGRRPGRARPPRPRGLGVGGAAGRAAGQRWRRIGRVQLWDMQSSRASSLLACSAYVLVTSPSPVGARLFIGHAGGGISCWEVRAAAENTREARKCAGNAMQQQP